MHRRRLVTGLTVAFAVMTAALTMVGVLVTPVVLVLAAVFAVVTGLLWYQASGRLASRVYRRVERQAATSDGGQRRRSRGSRKQQGGFGAGPKEDWTGPRRGPDGRGRRSPGQGSPGQGRRQRHQRRRASAAGTDGSGLTAREAAGVLGIDPAADQSTVKRAYRERIKETHPDTEEGDEERFQRVQAAYERLSD